MQKPEITFYQHVEKSTGLSGANILFVDDRIGFLVVPQELGWRTIRFNRSDLKNCIEKLTSLLS